MCDILVICVKQYRDSKIEHCFKKGWLNMGNDCHFYHMSCVYL